MYGPIVVRYTKTHYTRKFVLDMEKGQHNCIVTTDWGCITGVESIHLGSKEVIIEGKLSDMGVVINYTKIGKFVVEFDEE